MAKINVQQTDVTILKINEDDYISLTDIAKFKSDDPTAVTANWMRNRNTIEYLGIWETLYNADFKPLEFEGFRTEAGLNAFTLSPQKWIDATNAKGIISKPGRYGGTFAHKDIAFKFAAWISIEFELYFIKEFQRLKEEEQKQIGWTAKRELAKINYRIRWRAEMFDFDGFDTPLNINDDIPEFAAEAASLRAQGKADIVIMLTSMNYPGISGAATPGAPSYNSAFAIVEIQDIADPRWTFAHEFAHLLGADHNRPDNCSNDDVCGDSNTDNCAHGWLFDDQSGSEQRTIMARMFTSEAAVRLPHYSNPDINFNGAPTGTEENDNSRIIRNAACFVDDYNRAEWNVGIQGPPKWCLNLNPVITFNAVVTPPNPGWGLPGNPPYQYEWRASCSPTYNPSTFLSNQPSITLNTPFCEPSFWLHLTVTSADGLTRTSRRRVGIVEECPHFQGEVEDRGLKNNQLQNLGKIYPNPTEDKFDILIAPFEGKCTEIILSDNFGRLVKHIKSCESGSIEIPVETLPHGIYFVSVRSESKIETHKLIIQN